MAKWTLGVVLSGIAIAGAALSAHHSLAGVYALGKEAKVHGTFNSFKIVNPHSSMKLDVKNSDGTVTEWSFVGGSAFLLASVINHFLGLFASTNSFTQLLIRRSARESEVWKRWRPMAGAKAVL